MDFQRWLREAARELSESESPKRDAEILLEHVTGKARTYLLAFGETELTAEQLSQLEALLARRKNGEPGASGISISRPPSPAVKPASRWRIWLASASSGHFRCMSQRRR